jgi:hypothetical protein
VLEDAPCTGLSVRVLDRAIAPPANVAALVRVGECDGAPIGRRLGENELVIAEDDVVLSPYEADRKIIPAERSQAQRTLVLLDMSGSIVRANLREPMIAGARELVHALDGEHAIAIFGFDGRPDLVPIQSFTTDRLALDEALTRTAEAMLIDDSTNLNGAMVNALQVLDRFVEAEEIQGQQVAHGSLVVFTDGRDLARRVSTADVDDALDATAHSTFAIGVGADVDANELANLGRTKSSLANGPGEIVSAFIEVAAELSARAASDYVVSYCSPARAGARVLSISAHDGERYGTATFVFNAEGFGAGCSPSLTPLR